MCEGHCTGVPTIQEELEMNGSPEAVFETDPDRQSVCVTIPIHPRFLEKKDADQAVNEETNIGESSVKFGESSVKFGDIVLSGTQNMIIQMIEANNQVSAKRIAEEMSLSVRGVEKNIKELREKGILKRNGSARGGYWEIIEKK